jgi:hypothetical protein
MVAVPVIQGSTGDVGLTPQPTESTPLMLSIWT